MATPNDEMKVATQQTIEPRSTSPSIKEGDVIDNRERREVFKASAEGVDFRTLTWQRMIIILLKIQVATGVSMNEEVLAIPSSMVTLGAVPGALVVVGWQALNTYTACILIDFRNRNPHCHTIVDMCGVLWGPIGRELVGVMFLVAFILCAGSGLLGTSIAFNALSEHGACTVWFSFVATILVILYSSIRTWDRMTWPMTLAFMSVLGGVLAVVVGVTLVDRPAAAPAEGDFDLGFQTFASPEFAAGVTATASIFIASASGPGYIPVVVEMRRPQDYRKAVIPVSIMVGSIYLSVSLVVYYYCGQWIATPSLGSAGPLIKKIAYGIALPSLIVSAGIFNHTAAKYAFVRLLRNSPHLQRNSWQHWTSWVGLNVLMGSLAFIFASAIPVFNYILSLAGSVCFAPMSLIFPALMWFRDFGTATWAGGWKRKAFWAFHLLIALVGTFMAIGGIYGTAVSIKETYDASTAVAFSCADNSNTVA